ncbi:hypothetical protein REC12_20380 [Desulfosporosinus sp. PR]|uniref:hypothetical protein n=1 Tax=Candidatus Desulfosporosinus nitrosoreducens TaxID=3401928 RepID=UPI0027F1C6B5|nr:hypothetical protein [Desulfosporosinus sp. PR]MDQ7095955.1 hypothetical protein [Desulfosporosinus sp. PR]
MPLNKENVYRKELAKLSEIFKDVEEPKRQLVEGLIQDAAFLLAENTALKELLSQTGMVKIHPKNPEMQKPVEASKQYLKNVNSYAVIIKTLNGVLMKGVIEVDDDLDEFE